MFNSRPEDYINYYEAIAKKLEENRKAKMSHGLKNDFNGVFEKNAKIRALTEAELNSLIQDCYANGGRPDWLLGSYTQVNKLAQLLTSKKEYSGSDKEFVSQMLVYSSPFGRVIVEGDSQIADDTLAVLQKDMWAIAQLRPVVKKDTPETADAKNGVLIGELMKRLLNREIKSNLLMMLLMQYMKLKIPLKNILLQQNQSMNLNKMFKLILMMLMKIMKRFIK